MKTILTIALGLTLLGCSKPSETADIKSILLEQLKNTHTNQEWFVPTNVAVKGLTAEQSNWKDSTDNHSIAELVSHLIFWNERVLLAYQKNTTPDFKENNEVTFKKFTGQDWELATKKLDSIQTTWEELVLKATDSQLNEWSSSIANICSHNAYHTGQIIYIRKRNGWWEK